VRWAAIHACSRALALFDVPRISRAAIRLIVKVVSRRNRAAIRSFSGSL
jgi:hypothetical protein